MSGIVGLWNLDGRPVEPHVLSKMGAALAHRGPDGEAQWVGGSVGLAWQHLWVVPEQTGENRPVAGRSGSTLVMDGRLDNRDELVSTLELRRNSTDAACVLAAYEMWGESFAAHLNGDFALALFDPRDNRLVLVRDPLGIRPLYYFRNGLVFAFASEIKGLLAHPLIPAIPEDEAIADYLLVASRPVDRQELTCFKNIFAVVASQAVTVTPERLVTRQYWDFDTTRSLRLGSFEEYVEAFRERFAEAVRRRTRGSHPAAVSLSGGLDSSSIFCQAETLRRAGASISPGTLGVCYLGAEGTVADERRYLDDIEAMYRIPLDRISVEPLLGVIRGAREQMRAIEAPLLFYLWGVTEAMHLRARDAGARTLLTGHWGDQMMFSSAYLADLFRGLELGKIRRHTDRYLEYFGREEVRDMRRWLLLDLVRHYVPRSVAGPLKWLRRKIFPAEGTKPWLSAAFRRQALRTAHRPSWHDGQFHSIQARSLYLEARSKYHVHCMEANNKVSAHFGMDTSFPFLDRDLVSFLIAIPGEIQNHGGVPRGLLREGMAGILPEPLRARTWKGDFTPPANQGMRGDIERLAQQLSRGSLASRMGYLDERQFAALLPSLAAELSGGECVATWDISDIFGLETWLQVFFSRGSAELGAGAAIEKGSVA